MFTGNQAKLFADACESTMEANELGAEEWKEIPLFSWLTDAHRNFLVSQLRRSCGRPARR